MSWTDRALAQVAWHARATAATPALTPGARRAGVRGTDAAHLGAVAAILLCAAAGGDSVIFRNGDKAFGTVEATSEGGLSLRRPVDRNIGRPAADSPHLVEMIGWDRIESIEFDGDGGKWTALQTLLDDGRRLWRARIRLERGDARMAEHAVSTAWAPRAIDGPTSAVAAMIELQVALSRGERARALRAQFEVLRLRRRGFDAPSLLEWVEPSAAGGLIRRLVLDTALPLCPVLPPFARDDEERRAMLDALDHFDARGDAELEELRAAFASAVDPARDPTVPPPPSKGAERDEESEVRKTLEFLRALRSARSADPAERAKGREALSQQRRRLPEWAEAWGRFASGESLLLDGTPQSMRAGQLELLHLPARFAESQPLLAPFAAQRAARASADLGRPDESPRIVPAPTAAPARRTLGSSADAPSHAAPSAAAGARSEPP